MKRYLSAFWCAFICRYGYCFHSVLVRDVSGTHRFSFGYVSANFTQFGVILDLIQSSIGLELVSGQPTYATYITDLRLTNHLPTVAELKLTRPWILPDKTDTTPDLLPTANRQFVGERYFKHVWKISHQYMCVSEHKPTQTDETESILIATNLSLNLMIFFGLRSFSCRFGKCEWSITVVSWTNPKQWQMGHTSKPVI